MCVVYSGAGKDTLVYTHSSVMMMDNHVCCLF